MHDLIVRGGTVVDGTGAPPRVADVAVDDGRITEVGPVGADGAETSLTLGRRDGAWVSV